MSTELFLSVDDLAGLPAFVFDVQTKTFTHITATLKEMLGIDIQVNKIEELAHLVFPDDREFLSAYLVSALAGSAAPVTTIRLTINDAEKWFKVSLTRLRSGTGIAFLGSVEDASAEMHNLLTVQKYTNKKNSILTMLSHDLRGPLGVARNLSQLLDREIHDAKLTRFIKTITKVIQQSIDLINDLTGREFLDSTSVELVKKRIDIAVKLREYMEENLKSEEISGRTFKLTTSHEHIFLELDEAKFMQIQNNLVSNALKFTHDGGVIAMDVSDLGNRVVFTFSDDGIGVPAKLQTEIFKEFTQAKRRGLKGEPTVGLGLSIVKTIVEWHHGKIWMESEEGKGTTFIFEIPK